MHQITYKKTAIKSLLKMPKDIQQKMTDSLEEIAASPRSHHLNWKPLSGSPYWRLRVGGYRAICDIQDNELVLLVIKIGPRGDIYK